MKTCSKCKLEKLESEFYKNPRSKYLLNYSCKTCFKNLVRKRSVFLNSTKPKRINKTDNPNYKKRIHNKKIKNY
jgi:NAD-dependent SIR2 family protein deacetylase